ncbi:porphobilinogen synthase [Flavobacteriaceae bacterium]|jgi:porphobilinogen synthase|nr:porphobilinogen synthase [Flavobacteriaceae bacterium]MBT5493882.1 porphobilinogen synthase [Flavobacteriaceae bacterium]MBT7574262.1 porphobilinogen synthase [Flavobacteriaceae bacterium]MDA7566427.1 porphobilinogen synthase [Flavobacteriaceae bacterium]MDA8808035.1 porphobilinogen synthase [Flavobacteriaceae bacterium]|tara:strand:- start:9054 stop:10028 length:975 start_codon:yes stop_codon:yes gene_type:complete
MYPLNRNRRLRSKQSLRNLIKESSLHPHDFIVPLFIIEGTNLKEEIPSMPNYFRYSLDIIKKEVKLLWDIGVQGVLLFVKVEEHLKDNFGTESFKKNGLMQKAIREIKSSVPDMTIMTDVALDPYSSYGHDGIVKGNKILNDQTNVVLSKMALSHAEAGADIVAPSDMMDGRVLSIRKTLEDNGFHDIGIMSYAVKYASNFYGPFRDALDSKPGFGDKKTYQMDFRNRSEAIAEAKSDIEEGADIIMVKPGISYLDVLRDLKNQVHCPLAIYQVSGEYSMLKAAAKEGWLDHDKVMMEQLVSMKRAGADIIASYFAKDAIKLLS